MSKNAEQHWIEYRDNELAKASRIVPILGFSLEEKQPHMQGERFLMQAVTVTGGKKLILLGRRTTDNARVVIKATTDFSGIKELLHEHIARQALQKIGFSYDTFFFPKELLFTKQEGMIFSIQEFIEHDLPFLERPTPEQFSLALNALKLQECAHATTYRHQRFIKKTFGSRTAETYLTLFESFSECVTPIFPEYKTLLEKVTDELKSHKTIIEQYGDFLTHTDFVPHNFRVLKGTLYLLDHSAIIFGNKHEGWARFINFMTLYNPELAEAFIVYVHKNRAPEENKSLKMMRLYRLGELMCYYVRTLPQSSENLHTLNTARVHFWAHILTTVLSDVAPSPEHINEYKQLRDTLRSTEEKERQVGLH